MSEKTARRKFFFYTLASAGGLLVLLLLGIYAYGLWFLSGEIKWLKDHQRPTTWAEFYQKYPRTSETAPEYCLLASALKIKPERDPALDYITMRSGDNIRLKPEEYAVHKKLLHASEAFRQKMYRLLDLPPVLWKIDHEEWEPERKVWATFEDYEYCRLFVALTGQDYAAAGDAVNNLMRYRKIILRNTAGDFSGFYIYVLPVAKTMLKQGVVTAADLARWKSELYQSNLKLAEDVANFFDYSKVHNIVDPAESLVGHGLASFHMEPLPWYLSFLTPYWRARQLQKMRQDEDALRPKAINFSLNAPGRLYSLMENLSRYVDDVSGADCRCLHICRSLFDNNEEFYYSNAAVAVRLEARTVYVAIAAEQYWLKYGKFPPSLEAMIPEFLCPLNQDPFADIPLLYQYLPDGSCRIACSSLPKNRMFNPDRFSLTLDARSK